MKYLILIAALFLVGCNSQRSAFERAFNCKLPSSVKSVQYQELSRNSNAYNAFDGIGCFEADKNTSIEIFQSIGMTLQSNAFWSVPANGFERPPPAWWTPPPVNEQRLVYHGDYSGSETITAVWKDGIAYLYVVKPV